MNIKQLAIKHKNVNNKEVTIVPFNDEVSIITGTSQKGKSAILEIIDYCLFSSKNIVPIGIVSDNSEAFALTLENAKYIFTLYRTVASSGKMKLDIIDNVKEEIVIDYNFENISQKKEDVQKEFEKLLGINITSADVKNYGITNNYKTEKYSIRYQVPFNLLAQNIIANKDVLFRNFSESRYRKNMNEQFAVFCGLETLEDYIIKQKITKLSNDKKRIANYYVKNKEEQEELLESINVFLEAFMLKGISKIGEFSEINEILGGHYDKLDGAKSNYYKLLEKIKKVKNEFTEKNKELGNDKYLLDKIKNNNKAKRTIKNFNEIYCPVCNTPNDSYGAFIKELKNSEEKFTSFQAENQIIVNELNRQILINEKELIGLKEELDQLYNEKRTYEANKLSGFDIQLFFKQYYELKQRVDLFNYTEKDEVSRLEAEIKKMKKLQKKINLKEFQTKLDDNLTKIVREFDIEESYMEMPLHFNIETFDYYFKNKSKKIYISNTGSGANWLSMHLALNISLIKTIKDLKLKSSFFNFLVLDQPTQVYFSDKDQKYGEINKVINIFESLFSISQKYGIQLIILEHAQSSSFSHVEEFSERYKEYEIKNWHNTEYGLLPFKSVRNIENE